MSDENLYFVDVEGKQHKRDRDSSGNGHWTGECQIRDIYGDKCQKNLRMMARMIPIGIFPFSFVGNASSSIVKNEVMKDKGSYQRLV